MPDRAEAVVEVPPKVPRMIVGRLKVRVGKALWGREDPVCAVDKAGRDRQNSNSSRKDVHTAAVLFGDLDSAENRVSAPAEGKVSALAEDKVSAPAEGKVMAPAEDKVSAPTEGKVMAPVESRILAPVEVGAWALAGVWRLVSAVVRQWAGWECGEWAHLEDAVLVPAPCGGARSLVEAGDIALAPVVDSAVVGDTHADRDEAGDTHLGKVAVRVLVAGEDMVEAMPKVSVPVKVLQKKTA